MTLQQLTLSNMKGLWRKYAGFLFSSVLSVLVFYLLASFVMHTDVVNGYVSQAERVRKGLLVSQYIIIVFTLFFVLYSSWAFVKSRKKEFGLLCLLGATKSQVGRLVVIEHAVVGAVSVAAGLGLGIPLSKLMLDAMSRVLQVTSPIRFMVVAPAVTLTVILFMALFIVIGGLTTLQISPRKIVRLLREHQRPKALPRYSLLVALLAFVCIGGGYAAAWRVTGRTLALAMLPVTFIVSLGTFLFFAQASVAILRILQTRLSFFYKRLNLVTIGDLTFRMKENAWVLATVSVLSAAVITSMGTIYTAQATMLKQQEEQYPHAVTVAVRGSLPTDFESDVASDIDRILTEDKVAVMEEIRLRGLLIAEDGDGNEDGDGGGGTLVISQSNYNGWASDDGRDLLDLDGTKVAMLQPFVDPTGQVIEDIPVDLTVGSRTFSVQAKTWPFPHTNYLRGLRQFVVVADAMFDRISRAASPEDRAAFFSYEFKDWQKAMGTSRRIRAAIPEAEMAGFSSRMEGFEDTKQITGLTAMIALFVTVLFFIAAGSMLYLRLFGEIQEDRQKYRSMRKLGISTQEVNRVVTAQILVIFFAPIAVGAAHCMFAMKALSNVLMVMDWPFLGVYRYALASLGVFSLIQAVYFLVARNAYIEEIGDATASAVS